MSPPPSAAPVPAPSAAPNGGGPRRWGRWEAAGPRGERLTEAPAALPHRGRRDLAVDSGRPEREHEAMRRSRCIAAGAAAVAMAATAGATATGDTPAPRPAATVQANGNVVTGGPAFVPARVHVPLGA